MKSTRLALACAFAVCFAPSSFLRGENFRESYGQLFQRTNNPPLTLAPNPSADYVRRWNQIAINANGLDHTPVAPGEDRVFGEQLGPGRSSRAMAIVHIAIADAVAVSRGEFTSYTGLQPRTHAVSMDTAIAQAAHDTLAALYPSQAASFDSLLVADLHAIHDGSLAKAHGRNVGHLTAATVLALRHDDGSQVPEPRVGIEHITSNLAGHWRQDPISLVPLALGAKWGECTPFVLDTTSQFRVPPPPSMKSAKYAAAYHEAKRLGGDGITTPTQRTPDQTFVGIFWAYDGTPSLCAPPRMYNQIAVQVADQTNLNAVQLARLLALVNVAMADTGMSVWESKYHWDFWRPITGIRESDVGTGPTGTGDRNPHTHGDSNFVPLGAPASNLTGLSFGTRCVWRRGLRSASPFLRHGSAWVHLCLRRIQWNHGREQWSAARLHPAHFRHPLASRRREWPEPDLPRDSLELRQNRRHQAGAKRGRLRLRPHLHGAVAGANPLSSRRLTQMRGRAKPLAVFAEVGKINARL
ncbi:MAG: hypothetical protein ABI883_03905 [Chthoniobacterales bacterium]